jgi:hypothetical protein
VERHRPQGPRAYSSHPAPPAARNRGAASPRRNRPVCRHPPTSRCGVEHAGLTHDRPCGQCPRIPRGFGHHVQVSPPLDGTMHIPCPRPPQSRHFAFNEGEAVQRAGTQRASTAPVLAAVGGAIEHARLVPANSVWSRPNEGLSASTTTTSSPDARRWPARRSRHRPEV